MKSPDSTSYNAYYFDKLNFKQAIVFIRAVKSSAYAYVPYYSVAGDVVGGSLYILQGGQDDYCLLETSGMFDSQAGIEAVYPSCSIPEEVKSFDYFISPIDPGHVFAASFMPPAEALRLVNGLRGDVEICTECEKAMRETGRCFSCNGCPNAL